MSRPAVDVVVPFAGSATELQQLCARLAEVALRAGDSLLVVDNTPNHDHDALAKQPSVSVLRAAEQRTPGFARNRGAAQGSGDWIVFFDADSTPSADLLDRYFEPEPGARTAMLAGGVQDEPVPPGAPSAARYAYIRAVMSQENTFRFGDWAYPVTANVAIRRAAFEAVGGFRDELRAAEDADLSYRLQAAGWGLERRERARVTHRARQTLRSFAAQKAIHGAGGAWLERHYEGVFPARRRPGLLWWGLRTTVAGLVRAIQTRDRDRALWALYEPVEVVVWEFGRSLPNERPLTSRVWWRALRHLRPGRGAPRV